MRCIYAQHESVPGVPKNGPLVYFDNNFGKYGPILTIFSLLQQEIYGTQKLSYFSHLTFIMLPLYLAVHVDVVIGCVSGSVCGCSVLLPQRRGLTLVYDPLITILCSVRVCMSVNVVLVLLYYCPRLVLQHCGAADAVK